MASVVPLASCMALSRCQKAFRAKSLTLGPLLAHLAQVLICAGGTLRDDTAANQLFIKITHLVILIKLILIIVFLIDKVDSFAINYLKFVFFLDIDGRQQATDERPRKSGSHSQQDGPHQRPSEQ